MTTALSVLNDVWAWAMTLQYIEYVPRILVGLLLGFLIGLERRSRHKAVGVRTYMIIAGSSALITLSGVIALEGVANGDPTRLAGQIMAGIGMIGAGVILKRGFNATGVTTAAFILLAVGAGIMAGFGIFALSIVSVIIVLLATVFAGRLFSSKEYAAPVHVVCKAQTAEPDDIIALFGANAILNGFKQLPDGTLELDIQPQMTPQQCESLLHRLLANPVIIEASQEHVD